jgi:hypothetical protein
MTPLNPELKRLMRWAQQAPLPPTPAVPLGFSSRAIARSGSISALNSFALWQKAIWCSAWAAAAVILFGTVLLTAQKLRTSSPYDFSPAYQVVALELVP